VLIQLAITIVPATEAQLLNLFMNQNTRSAEYI